MATISASPIPRRGHQRCDSVNNWQVDQGMMLQTKLHRHRVVDRLEARRKGVAPVDSIWRLGVPLLSVNM
jgi:hypothetical protein